MNQEEWIEKLKAEGWQEVQACENPPNTKFPEHTHEQEMVHVIVQGELTLVDADGSKSMKVGDRFNIPAGTKHGGFCGAEGCTFLAGWKHA